jgi:hypothetical protein
VKTRSQIRSAAIDLAARECALVLQACITHLEHAKQRLGFSGLLSVTAEHDAEGESLAASIADALGDCLPLDPKLALQRVDDGVLRCDELEYMQDEVREAVLHAFEDC